MNGATQTFRRPSLATNFSHSRDNHQSSVSTPTSSAAYIPPHLNSSYQSRNGSAGDSRYSKEQLLNIYKSQRESGTLGKNVEDFFVADWNPHEETPAVNGAWGKREDPKDTPLGPGVCWDREGQFEPLGLTDMNDDEKEVRGFFSCFRNGEKTRLN
jgi:PERQ amino acid-rich with GYF domain-containing protein